MSRLANPIAAPASTVERQPGPALASAKPKQQSGKVTAEQKPFPSLTSSGQPLPDALRNEFEPFFGHDLARVRIHTDRPAQSAAENLAADAFAVGSNIAFAANRYLPNTVGGRRLLIHELAHVLQQGSPGITSNFSPLPPQAEREADQAAHAYLAGNLTAGLSSFRPGLACAPVKTNGGEFDTDLYTPTNLPPRRGGNVKKRVGANIMLRFKPNDLVQADLIGMVQSVKNLKNKRANRPLDTLNTPTSNVAARSLGPRDSDFGRHIDQTDMGTGRRGAPNTSPIYATNAQRGSIPKTLTDAEPATENAGGGAGYGKDGFGEHGYRKKKGDGSFETKNATLEDHPISTLEFNHQEVAMTFETTALALSGPMANTYLGSVEWGWKCDKTGIATIEPAAIKLVSPGLPSGAFIDSAKKWNDAKSVTDPKSRKNLDTINLPLPSSATESSNKPATERTTGELLTSLDEINNTLRTAKDVDKNAKALEKSATEQALSSRQAIVNIEVNKTEDWTGADEVYAELSSGSKRQRTPVKSLNDGQSGNFILPLPSLMPINGPITVHIYDKDTGTFFDQDDLIVNMPWQPPYGAIRNTRSLDEADYDVRVRFNK